MCTNTTNRLLEHMERFRAAIVIKKNFRLHFVSMAHIVVHFADSPGSTIHDAESTDFKSLHGRRRITPLCCNMKHEIYVRARKHGFICLHGISRASFLLDPKLLMPYPQLRYQQLSAAISANPTRHHGMR